MVSSQASSAGLRQANDNDGANDMDDGSEGQASAAGENGVTFDAEPQSPLDGRLKWRISAVINLRMHCPGVMEEIGLRANGGRVVNGIVSRQERKLDNCGKLRR